MRETPTWSAGRTEWTLPVSDHMFGPRRRPVVGCVNSDVFPVDEPNGPEEGSRGPGPHSNTALFLWRGCHSKASGRDTAAFLSIGVSGHEESQVLNQT